MRYRLKDDGYSFRWIMRGRERVGRVYPNTDNSFTGVIGKITAIGQSWNDALNQVVAEYEGLDISELSSDVIAIKPVQERTQAILKWLREHAANNDGCLNGSFTNTDIAHAAGWMRPNRALGNLMSRLDLCCARRGFPAIGCAAEKTFDEAWQNRETDKWNWKWPQALMARRAKKHQWTDEDFDMLEIESRALQTGSAHLAWKEEMAKHEVRIKEWAHTEEENIAA